MMKHPPMVVVIGASAGGLAPLREILSQLSADCAATIFVVLHLHHQHSEHLTDVLGKRTTWPVQWATDLQVPEAGTVYLAPGNHHLFLESGQMRVLFGPRECGSRPSIDVLFRSAAVAYGNRVLGVMLSGKLDDGARGLQMVQRCGGTTVVQDPGQSEEPEMPLNAMRYSKIDACLSAAEIGAKICQSSERAPAQPTQLPGGIELENRLARDAMSPRSASPWNLPEGGACPECGGDLQLIDAVGHYRCYLGHAFGSSSLLREQHQQLEQALWTALRALRERHRVLDQLAQDYHHRSSNKIASTMAQRALELETHYRTVHHLLVNLPSPEDLTPS